MNDRQERQGILEYAYVYGDYMACAGDRIVARGFCCHICGSSDPSEECLKPRKKPQTGNGQTNN